MTELMSSHRVKSHTIRDLLFAVDCALNADSEADLQNSVDRFSEACSNFELTINTEKTEFMKQPASGKTYSDSTILVNGEKLKVVNRFTYFGSTLYQDVTIDDEVNARISKARRTFGILFTNIWHQSGISVQIKLNVYRATVLSVLLYPCAM